MSSNTSRETEKPPMERRTTGLYQKFDVRRADGSDARGGTHHGCDYFVLDLSHDRHALPAIAAYAESCRADYPALAADLEQMVPQLDARLGTGAQMETPSQAAVAARDRDSMVAAFRCARLLLVNGDALAGALSEFDKGMRYLEAVPPSPAPAISADALEGVTVAGARAFWAMKDGETRHEALRVAVMTAVSDPHLDWTTARAALTAALNADLTSPPTEPAPASETPEPLKVSESFLRGVVSSTTSYSEGWRDLCARLLWTEQRILQLAADLDTSRAGEAELKAAVEECKTRLALDEQQVQQLEAQLRSRSQERDMLSWDKPR